MKRKNGENTYSKVGLLEMQQEKVNKNKDLSKSFFPSSRNRKKKYTSKLSM